MGRQGLPTATTPSGMSWTTTLPPPMTARLPMAVSYTHLDVYKRQGQGVVVPYRDVLALFDLDNTSASHLTRRFLERAEQAGQVVNVAEDLPKSFVLCRPAGGEATVYLSQLSTATLLRRAENNSFE